MKRIAIITASIGSGHNQAAKYLKESLEKSMPTGEFVIFDLLEDKKIYSLIRKVYLEVLERVPNFYSKAYYHTKKQKSFKSLIRFCNQLTLKCLEAIETDYEPDGFVFTHPLPAVAYNNMKLAPAWVVITDYDYHPMWYNPEISGFFVATEYIADSIAKTGYPFKNIHVTGIPVSEKFIELNQITSKNEYTYHLRPPEILIMGGGLGFGPLESIIDDLKEVAVPFTSTVLTGENLLLLQYLRKKLHDDKRWKIVGYTDNVEMYMKKASLLITKAGALTITEASVCGLPLLIYKPLPGHEEENAKYFCEYKAALLAKTSPDLIKLTTLLLADCKKMEDMARQSNSISKPYAAKDVTDLILYQLGTPIKGGRHEKIV